jgi:hypothetical protein
MPPIIFTVSTDAAKRRKLEDLGAEVITAATDSVKEGKTDLAAICRVLGERGFNEVTIETGAKLNGSLLSAGVIDEIVLYLAPKILGDAAQGLFALPDFTSLDQALKPRVTDVRHVGEDLRLPASSPPWAASRQPFPRATGCGCASRRRGSGWKTWSSATPSRSRVCAIPSWRRTATASRSTRRAPPFR